MTIITSIMQSFIHSCFWVNRSICSFSRSKVQMSRLSISSWALGDSSSRQASGQLVLIISTRMPSSSWLTNLILWVSLVFSWQGISSRMGQWNSSVGPLGSLLCPLPGTTTLIRGRQFLMFFLNSRSNFQATTQIHEPGALQSLQLSHISWMSSRNSSTNLYLPPSSFFLTVPRSMVVFTIRGQSVSPSPFQSTGCLNSTESFESMSFCRITCTFLSYSLPSPFRDPSRKLEIIIMQSLQGNNNIRVACRVRPFNEKELAENCQSALTIDGDNIRLSESLGADGFFHFDHVFNPITSQQQVYDRAVAPMVEHIFGGLNLTIFAYGQTSSGKTFTMQGYGQQKGVVPRLLEEIFRRVEGSPPHIEFRLKVSVIEIYMERIKDILTPSGVDLKVRESKNLGIFVEGVTEVYVGDCQEVIRLLDIAGANRSVSATGMNDTSSRSHSLLTLTLFQNDLQDLSAMSSRVYLVDLAGSEKVSKTGAEGKLLDQAKGINKSLSSLGNVINALAENRGGHVPYRDSKLTRILQESLGGNSRTLLIITCSPASSNASQSLSTLRFGSRAKSIKNKPKVNRQYTVQQLLVLLEKAESRIKQQQTMIDQLSRQSKASKPVEQLNERLSKSKSILERVAIMEQEEQEELEYGVEDQDRDKDQDKDKKKDKDKDKKKEKEKEEKEEKGQGYGQGQVRGKEKEEQEDLRRRIAELEQELLDANRMLQIEKSKKQQFLEEAEQLHQLIKLKEANIKDLSDSQGKLQVELDVAKDQQSEMKMKMQFFQIFKAEIEKERGEVLPVAGSREQLRGMQLTIQQLEETARKLNIANTEKQNSISLLLDKIEQFSSYAFGEQSQHLHQQLRGLLTQNERLRVSNGLVTDFERRETAFLKQKNKLFSDLKDRIEKVLVLEEELDLEKDKRFCLQQCLKKDKMGQRLHLAEQSYNDLNQKYLSLKAKECLWKNQNEFEQRRQKLKDERIRELQQKLIQQKVSQAASLAPIEPPKPVLKQPRAPEQELKGKRMVKVFSSVRFHHVLKNN